MSGDRLIVPGMDLTAVALGIHVIETQAQYGRLVREVNAAFRDVNGAMNDLDKQLRNMVAVAKRAGDLAARARKREARKQ